jgi:hypothetical protein
MKPFDTAIFLASEGKGRKIVRHKAKQALLFPGGPGRLRFLSPDGPGKADGRLQKGQGGNGYAAGRRETSLARSPSSERSRLEPPQPRPLPSARRSEIAREQMLHVLHDGTRVLRLFHAVHADLGA